MSRRAVASSRRARDEYIYGRPGNVRGAVRMCVVNVNVDLAAESCPYLRSPSPPK
jgi:hypothetical protein